MRAAVSGRVALVAAARILQGPYCTHITTDLQRNGNRSRDPFEALHGDLNAGLSRRRERHDRIDLAWADVEQWRGDAVEGHAGAGN